MGYHLAFIHTGLKIKQILSLFWHVARIAFFSFSFLVRQIDGNHVSMISNSRPSLNSPIVPGTLFLLFLYFDEHSQNANLKGKNQGENLKDVLLYSFDTQAFENCLSCFPQCFCSWDLSHFQEFRYHFSKGQPDTFLHICHR